MNGNNRIAATSYSLGTQFVSGISVSIPCIKEMMMMIVVIIIIIIIRRRIPYPLQICNLRENMYTKLFF